MAEKKWLSVRKPTGVYIGWVNPVDHIKPGDMIELHDVRRLVSQMSPRPDGGFSQTTVLLPLDFLPRPVAVLHVRLDCYYVFEEQDTGPLNELIEGAVEMEAGMRLAAAGLHGPKDSPMANFPGDRHGG